MNGRLARGLVVAVAVGLTASASAPLSAAEPARDLREMKLFRFEFDNDTFVGSDDAFSAGWSIQFHSRLADEWVPGLAGWIGRIPTLGDDGKGGRVTRWAWGLTQIIITPTNVTQASAQANDAPWAGLLGGYASWSSYDNKRLGALQLYLGCTGPCSHAQEAQTFVHDHLHLGDHPSGWGNQLDDKVLFNVNYEYRHKLWSGAAHYNARRIGNDLSVGTQVGVGNFATYGEAWLEYRFGWDIPQGFAKLADPPALGVALDPVYLDPNGPAARPRTWLPYFNLIARHRAFHSFAAIESGDTINGGYYQQTVSTPGDNQLVFGVHLAKLPMAFHITYYRYFQDSSVTDTIHSTLDWVNISFERRF
jgi:hypothetical protein